MSYYDQKSLPAYSNVPSMTPQTYSPAHMGGQQVSYAPAMQSAVVPHQQVQPMQAMMPAQMSQLPMAPVTYAQPPMVSAAYSMPAMSMANGLDNLCARGHSYKTEYGICGIITAVVFFPIGLIALCVDRDKVCRRCAHKH